MKKIFVRLLTAFIPSKQRRKKFRQNMEHRIHTETKSYIKKNNKIIFVASDGHEIINPSFCIDGLDIVWEGQNSVLKIYEPCHFVNSKIHMGNDNFIQIETTKYMIENLEVCYKMSDNSSLYIGKDFSCCGAKLYLHDETNNFIKIGNDVMFSFDIVLWPSDGHTIYDMKTHKILNTPKKGISIGNHCWVGRGCSFLKDSSISDNTICGAMSVITKSFTNTNCIIAGIPSKVIKEGIGWDRKNTSKYKGIFYE